jgi:hypothetical protein
VTSGDVVLLLIIGASFLLGFLWGVVRSLLMLAAWFVVFIVSAYLSEPVGNYLSGQWNNLEHGYVHMVAFGLLYGAGLIVAVILVWQGTRGSQGLTRFAFLDDLVGGLVLAGVAVLGIAGVMVVLGTYYTSAPTLTGDWSANIYHALLLSSVGSSINQNVLPGLSSILGPVLPASIRHTMNSSVRSLVL